MAAAEVRGKLSLVVGAYSLPRIRFACRLTCKLIIPRPPHFAISPEKLIDFGFSFLVWELEIGWPLYVHLKVFYINTKFYMEK
jgi:hypothetical protein